MEQTKEKTVRLTRWIHIEVSSVDESVQQSSQIEAWSGMVWWVSKVRRLCDVSAGGYPSPASASGWVTWVFDLCLIYMECEILYGSKSTVKVRKCNGESKGTRGYGPTEIKGARKPIGG